MATTPSPSFDWAKIWYWLGPVLAAAIPAWDYFNSNPIFQSHNVLAASIIGAKVVHYFLDQQKPT